MLLMLSPCFPGIMASFLIPNEKLYKRRENLAAVRAGSRINPANRVMEACRGGRLAGIYNAVIPGWRLSEETEQCGALWRHQLAGVKCGDIYILSGWTHGLRLGINIHRHLILPSVKWQRAGRAVWIKDGRRVEIRDVVMLVVPIKEKNRTWFNHLNWVNVNYEWPTFKTRSLAELERRILSHQAGHLVFMYCFPWLLSSLYG